MRLRYLSASALVWVGLGATPAVASPILIYGMSAEISNMGLADPALTDGAYSFRLILNTGGYEAPDGDRRVGIDNLRTLAINFGITGRVDRQHRSGNDGRLRRRP